MLKSEEVLTFLYKPFSELFRKKRGGGENNHPLNCDRRNEEAF